MILVNDCSTDNTLELLKKYSRTDSRIHIINNTRNEKLPRSLNIGFSQASGQFLTWTSDDNTYHQNALEIMINSLKTHPEIDMVYADFNIVDLEGNILSVKETNNPDMLRYVNTVGACFLYRKSLADKIGRYDPDHFLAEDYEYWIRAYLNGNLMHISENLYDYGWHEKSLTATRKQDIEKATFMVKEKHFDALLGKCSNQSERNQFFREMLNLLADSKERRRVRKQYYKIDHNFAKSDISLRVKNGCNIILHSLAKYVKKSP